MARLSDRVVTGAPNGILSNDEPIQWYAADGITLIDGIKVDPTGAVYLAPAGGPTEVGGALDVSGTVTTNGPANTINTLNSSSGYSSLMVKSGDAIGRSYLFFNDASGENARVGGFDDKIYLYAGAAATITATFEDGAATIFGNLDVTGNIFQGTNPASAGDIRMAATSTIRNRNAANTGNITMVGTNASDEVTIASSGGGTVVGGDLEVTGQYRQSTAPATYAHPSADDLVLGTTVNGHSGMTIVSGTSGFGDIFFSNGTTAADQYAGYLQYVHSTDTLAFGVAGLPAMSINSSGDLDVSGGLAFTKDLKPAFNATRPTAWDTNSYVWSKSGASTGLHLDGYNVYLSTGNSETVGLEVDINQNVNIPNGNLVVDGAINAVGIIESGTYSNVGATSGCKIFQTGTVTISTTTTSTVNRINFYNPNGLVGRIRTSGSTTSYVTTSDPRLKSEFTPITNASEMILEARDQGMIGEFHFLADPTQTVWGYNAHKLIDAQPNFGGSEGEGSRDAPLGDEVTPAGVDQSKRVPLLEAAIGELLDRIKVLEEAGAK